MTVEDWPAFCRDCLSDAPADEALPQLRRHAASWPIPNWTASPSPIWIATPSMPPSKSATIPALNDKPLIVGGGTRGVVSTACYIARKYGVRSAMPMFQAKKLCPQAVIIKPRMAYYAEVARADPRPDAGLTPLVEPLSLDEAYLDLSGTEPHPWHGARPRPWRSWRCEIEREVGITVSIGLSGNKFLAKLACELDKPRGFAVIGMAEAKSFLRDKPVGIIRGAGKVLQARLERDGFATIGQLQDADPRDLANRYGATGLWLARMAQAQDSRAVDPGGEMKTISSETTFNSDLSRLADLEAVLWRQAERVSARAKSYGLAAAPWC